MSIDLAKLVVSMEANTVRFQREMEKVNGRMERFEKRTHAAVRGINRAFSTLGVGLSVGALAGLAKITADNVSQQRALAESAGLTTAKFSALNYAARQNQVSQEELGRVLARLNIVLSDAATGEERAEENLKKFGITSEMVRGGAVDTEKALQMIADRFAEMPNGFEKTGLAAELLGERLGPRMIQFLNLGSKGLAEFERKADMVGAVMHDKVADSIAKANDKLEAFAQTMQTKAVTAFAALFGLVEANEGDKAIESLTEQIAGLSQELLYLAESSKKAEEGGFLAKLVHTGDAARIAEINNQLPVLRAELAKLKAEQLDRMHGGGAVKPSPGPTLAPRELTAAEKAYAAELEKVRQAVLLVNDAEGEAAQMRAKVNALYAQGKIPQDAYLAFLEEANQELDRFGEVAKEADEKVSVMADQAARNIQSFTASLVDAALAGENMGDVIVASLRRIAAEMLTASMLQGIGGLFGSFGFADFGGMIAGKAAGGPVSGGTPYIVGEEGPELFVPGKSGTIIPNDALGGGGVNIEKLVVDNRGATGEAAAMFARSVPALAAQIEGKIAEGLARGRYKVAAA